ncbi:type III secretion protein [Deltaproteobacteria bacterium Smac51]|nr:type III secretion protein [Deltaproteobacteria bacterium Smac51]
MVSGYPLESLRHIRELREDEARKIVLAAEAEVGRAAEARGLAEDELSRYRQWRADETERRYDSIMHLEMSLAELEAFKASLAALADHELVLEEKVRLAVKDEENARSALAAARALLVEASKSVGKIEAHREIWLEQEGREAERLEELELEDFRVSS